VVVTDLESYIRDYMGEQRIPGLAIALVRDGKIAWTEGFGVANVITGKPVTADTLFEVASNGKVLTAYIALRLVHQGVLSLDTPLNDYLPEPWLPASEHRGAITLRHVLSHSSGLGHGAFSRESLFAPSRGYSYSAVGFLYLQAVLEQVTGQSLESLAQDLLFAPLGMASSSYVNREDLTARTANGHLWAVVPALLFAALYVVVLALIVIPGWLVLRLWTGRWLPSGQAAWGVVLAALIGSLLAVFLFFRHIEWLEFAWLIALCGLVLVGAPASALFAARVSFRFLGPSRPLVRTALAASFAVMAVVGLGLLAFTIRHLPVPRWPAVSPSAAGSVRATAADMATFMIELAHPTLLGPETAAQLRTSQIQLTSNLSWGLGPGILHSQEGEALWQWGQHIDFQSLVIIYPEHGLGVVVLTNSDLLSPDVAIEVAHRAVGGQIDPLRRASHLEFNYRPEQ
jgi:CubicO group peptidase (beta-lactamase class C family)